MRRNLYLLQPKIMTIIVSIVLVPTIAVNTIGIEMANTPSGEVLELNRTKIEVNVYNHLIHEAMY